MKRKNSVSQSHSFTNSGVGGGGVPISWVQNGFEKLGAKAGESSSDCGKDLRLAAGFFVERYGGVLHGCVAFEP
jgi:hypothetical protein